MHGPGEAGRDPRAAAGRRARYTASPSTPSSATWRRSSCRASRTGSRPTSSATFPRTTPARRSWASCSRPGSGVQGMLWATSPACTELETHVLDWLVDLLGLPPHFKSTSTGGGVIQDSASSAALCAILAARERATDGQSNLAGADGSLVAYASTQAHSSVEKGVRIAGLGSDNLRLIEVDEHYAMRPDRLAEAIAADRAAGLRPCFVCATVGTTSSTAIDPLREIGRICRRHGLWLHVDAALAGTAALVPRVPPPLRRPGTGRQLLLQSAQVDVHQFRLRLLFRGRPGPVDPHAEHSAGVSPQPGHRVGGGDRLSRLAGSAGAAIPRPEAVVRDPLLRRRRAARRGSASTWSWRSEFAGWVQQEPRFELAAPVRVRAGLLPPSRRRRGQPADPRCR